MPDNLILRPPKAASPFHFSYAFFRDRIDLRRREHEALVGRGGVCERSELEEYGAGVQFSWD